MQLKLQPYKATTKANSPQRHKETMSIHLKLKKILNRVHTNQGFKAPIREGKTRRRNFRRNPRPNL